MLTTHCIHKIEHPFCKECHIIYPKKKQMSGCVPNVGLSEKEMHDNSLYTKIKELEIENKNLHYKIEKLKDLLSDVISKI